MLTIGAVGALIALALFDVVRRLILTRIGMKLEAKLGGPLLVAGVQLGIQKGQSDVQPLRDLASVRSFLSGPVVPQFFDLLTMPLYTAIVFLIHPQLGYIVIAGILLLFIFALINQTATSRVLGQGYQHSTTALAHAEAQVRNADSVRSMGMLVDCLNMWGDSNREAVTAFRTANDRNTLISSLSKLVRFLLQIAVLGWGAYLSLEGQLTAGIAIAASIIASRALAPIEGTIEGWRGFVSTRQAYIRIKHVLAKISDFGERTLLPPPKGDISIDKLIYHPAESRELIVKGVSFEIPAGTSVAMIGATGAGKSTLARLLAGAIQPVSGGIKLDGADLRTWDPLQLGDYVGFLPQGVQLFPGTVAQNIARMRVGATSQQVVEAATFAGAHELILNLPNGYETEIHVDGTPLSGGQRQRVGLARAFFGSPRVVVLDEPDANLDRAGEKALLDTLLRTKEAGITVVMVTQRSAMLRYVDRILAVTDGMIEAYSPREAFVKKANSRRSQATKETTKGAPMNTKKSFVPQPQDNPRLAL